MKTNTAAVNSVSLLKWAIFTLLSLKPIKTTTARVSVKLKTWKIFPESTLHFKKKLLQPMKTNTATVNSVPLLKIRKMSQL